MTASSDDVFATEWKQIEEEITCSICSDIFDEPKTLPCLHTFCKKCIQFCVETVERSNKNQHACPLCRLPFAKDKLASTPTNFVIIRLIEIFDNKRKRGKEEVRCGECEEGGAACMWCVECEKGLCKECHRAHTRMKSFKYHKTCTLDEFMQSPKAILTANPKPQYCTEHGQLLDLYCKTCTKLICRDCTYLDHPRGEHQFDFIKKVVEGKRTEIRKVTAPLQSLLDRVQIAIKNTELSKQGVDATCANNGEEIRSIFKDLRRILDAQEAEMLQNANGIKEASYNLLDAQKNDLLSLEKQLNNFNTSVLGMTRSSSIDELLTYIGWVDNRITDFTSLVDQADLEPVCTGDSVVWPPNFTEFASHCELLCHVAGSPYVPNCSVKVESQSSVIAVMLKDVKGFSVINQAKFLKVQHKGTQELYCDFQVKELAHGQYCISYCSKPCSINVMWKDTILNSEEIVLRVDRDYGAIQKETRVIHEYECTNFLNPWHLANGPKDELLVCDYHNHKVVVFNNELQYSHTIGSQGEGYGKFQSPSGIAVDDTGHLYIADQGNHCIQKFNIDGSFICHFGKHGNSEGQFNSPHGLVISKAGQLYVCDRGNHRIQVFKNHNFVLLFGRHGSNPGDFDMPSSMTFNNLETQLFVADSDNHRIQVFTPNGQFICVLNLIGAPHDITYPYSICFTLDWHLLITSQLGNVLMVFKEDGAFLCAIKGNGCFDHPAGVVTRHNGQIVVSGWSNNKLVVY